MLDKLHICLNMTGQYWAVWMGGVIYIQNLIRGISSLPNSERRNIKLSLLISRGNLKLLSPVIDCLDEIYVEGFAGKLTSKGSFALAKNVPFFPTSLLNPRHFDFVYPAYYNVKLPYSWGGWIPDFQHHYLPHLFTQEKIKARNEANEKLANMADVVVLSSKTAQEDFNRFYPGAKSRSRVMNFVSYIQPNWLVLDPTEIQKKYQLPDRFFLISNQFWPHKNHSVVVQALRELKSQGQVPYIICTGDYDNSRYAEYVSSLLSDVKKFDLCDNFRLLGLIPRDDQIQLMRQCLAVIQPSLFEGWSTVIEDARSLGKPVIASDFPVHLEQNPPSTQFFDRNNSEELASKLAEAQECLTPGPDFVREETIVQENLNNMIAYGRIFLKIATEAS